MMRISLPSFLPIVALMAAACGPSEFPGDVQYGEYTVEATLRDGGCDLRPGEEGRASFEFWARLGADVDGETAYLTVAEPPGNVEQRPRRGDNRDGELVFEVSEVQDIDACECLTEVTETITLTTVADADGGVPDGGTDGGTPDAGLPDGGARVPDVPGLPRPEAVTGVTGTLQYEVESGGNCPPLEQDADGGWVSGCQLPCTFAYDLEGTREE